MANDTKPSQAISRVLGICEESKTLGALWGKRLFLNVVFVKTVRKYI
jgi:hypothetical protein